jgi:hypothetical protein
MRWRRTRVVTGMRNQKRRRRSRRKQVKRVQEAAMLMHSRQ